MRKVFFVLVALCAPLLLVSCGGDDEPSGGENGSSGGSASGKTDNHEYVDLGLPSGTLWATMNVGASSPEDYGDYFAWGETTPKQDYSEDNYKWYNTVTGKYTKYSSSGYVGDKTELDPEDDAAYVNWGSGWRMPSPDQIKELMNECDWKWTTRNGVGGRLVTSKHNGASLFLPAAGYRRSGDLTGTSYCIYWSRMVSSSGARYAIGTEDPGLVNSPRYFGQSVRAVRVSQN